MGIIDLVLHVIRQNKVKMLTKQFKKLLGFILPICFILSIKAQTTPQYDLSWDVPFGTVRDVLIIENQNKVFYGGNFNYVGPSNGYGALVNTTNEEPNVSIPRPNGRVRAVESDGNGGWFIAGEFSLVGTVPRNGFAYINSDGSLNAWQPSLGTSVYDMARVGDTLYVVGGFSTVDGQPRKHAAAFQLANQSLTSWNPTNATTSGFITTVAATNEMVFLGGSFDNIYGKARLVGVSASTGASIAANTVFNLNNVVHKLIYANGKLFVRGAFNNPNHIQATSYTVNSSSSITWDSWDPQINGNINDIDEENGILYLVGTFTSIGGLARNKLAAYDYINNVYQSLELNATLQSTTVNNVKVHGTKVYLPGNYVINATQQAAGFMDKQITVDISTGTVIAGNSIHGGVVLDMCVSGNQLYYAGEFYSVGGKFRTNLASVDLATKKLTDWAPSIPGGTTVFDETAGVLTMQTDSINLFIGGQFTTVNGQPRTNVAAFNLSSGTLTTFNPSVLPSSGYVRRLLLVGDTLLIGGDFTSVAGQTRNKVALVRVSTGALGAWNPNPNNFVYTFYKKNNTLYVAGSFTSIGGQTTSIARYNWPAMTLQTPVLPITTENSTLFNRGILNLEERDGLLYVAGGFDYFIINNVATNRRRLAVYDLNANSLYADPNNYFNQAPFVKINASWYPGAVQDMLFDNGVMYLADYWYQDPVVNAQIAYSPNSSASCYNLPFFAYPLSQVFGYRTTTYNNQLLIAGLFRGINLGINPLHTGSVLFTQKAPAQLSSLSYSNLSVTGVVGTSISDITPTFNSGATFTVVNLPPGLFLNPTTGYITGTPTSSFSGNTVVTASNSCYTQSITLSFTISGPPQLMVSAAQNIQTTSAACSFSLPFNGGSPITSAGIYLATSPNPTTASSIIAIDTIAAFQIVTFSNLQPNTTYYFSGFAVNANGTTQTVVHSFVTAQGPEIFYPNPLTLTVSSAISPILPTNAGSSILAGSFGDVTLLAGSATASSGSIDGANTSARFNQPKCLAENELGEVYLGDFGNYKVRELDSTANVSTFSGQSTSGSTDGVNSVAKFSSPFGVATDRFGNVFVADQNNHRIRKIDHMGTVSTIAGSSSGSTDGTALLAKFNGPNGLCLDSAGNIYVADAGNHRIRKISPSGVVTTLAGSSPGFQDGTGTSAYFYSPTDITIDAAGNLYVTDKLNNRIRKITPTGVVTTLAGSVSSGGANGQGTAATFSQPVGIDIDNDGNLYVVEATGHRIRKITPSGLVSTVAGLTAGNINGGVGVAKFNTPSDVLVRNNILWISEVGNHDLRLVKLYAAYSISPLLPAGLLFDTQTGQISGTPSISSPATVYTIVGTNEIGADTFLLNLAVVAPMTFTSFAPSSGSQGSSVTLYGTNLSSVTSVVINGTTVSSFVIYGNDSIVAIVGAGTTTGPITISNGSQSLTSSSDYTIIASEPLDSDGDNIPDSTEGTVDSDNDGTPNYLDTDSDGDGVSDQQEAMDQTDEMNPCDFDEQHVSMPQTLNFLMADCDGDGLSNEEEQGGDPLQPIDSNANGVPDYLEYNSHSETPDDIEPFEAVSPNGDGQNDVFVIRNIEKYPDNQLQIFNRWGVLVYEANAYGQQNQFFTGFSDGRLTINAQEQLPNGTYYWILTYQVDGQEKLKKGYLYLNR